VNAPFRLDDRVVEINLADPGEAARVEAFVAAQPAATPFHRPAWLTAVAAGSDNRPLLLAIERGGMIAAILPLLDVLGLRGYFETVHLSTLSGAAKPSSRIFATALAAFDLAAAQACHVGDHPREDLQGALDAGMRAILLDPTGQFSHNPATRQPGGVRVGSLAEMLDLTFLQGT